MIDPNETPYMQRIRHGRDFALMLPEERLAYHEASLTKPVVAAPVEATPLTASQKAYLGDRRPEQLVDPVDIANYGSLKPKVEAPVGKEAAPLDGPVDWRTAKLDHGRMWQELDPTDRLAVVDALNRIQKFGVANSREIDRLQAESWLLRA